MSGLGATIHLSRNTSDEPPETLVAAAFRCGGLPVHRGDPGAPTLNLPIPDGWADAGQDTPATAYWAIIDNGPEAAKYTPSIVATVSKLVGDVDQQKILDRAWRAEKPARVSAQGRRL